MIGAVNDDEWRIDVELDDERHGYSLGERLRALNVDDKARERLGTGVIVTRDGSHLFLYAGSEQQAVEAERVIRDLLDEEGLSAEISTLRWHPVEQDWKDAAFPIPHTEESREAERRRREARELREAESEGSYDWQIRVAMPGRANAVELESRLADEGLRVDRRWVYLTIGAVTEERANELAERLRSELPDDAEVWVEPNLDDVPSPPFVLIGSWL